MEWIGYRGVIKWLGITLLAAGAIHVAMTFLYVTWSVTERGFLVRVQNQTTIDARLLMTRNDSDTEFSNSENTTTIRQCRPPWIKPGGSLNLTVDTGEYFIKVGRHTCLKEGTDFLQPLAVLSRCPCRPRWSGISCSIPDSVRYSSYPFETEGEPKIRAVPRRVIQAMPFNVEFEMLEARFAEVGDVVDAFMILESNYTAYGDPKPMRLLEKLKSGSYSHVACKIIHVVLDYFPEGAHQNGWIADSLLRDYIETHGVPNQLKNYRLDDVFMLSDADELLARENVLFLKLHDGWPEPVGYLLQRNLYGFFWRQGRSDRLVGGVTFGVLTRVLHNHAIWVRDPNKYLKRTREIQTYVKSHQQDHSLVKLWVMGNMTSPAGFHCTWCCAAECMRTKLVSAQNGDFPRWGDYPVKRNLTYIKGIIQRGLWFDNVSTLQKTDETDPHYAPQYMITNSETYKHLLVNPYKDKALFLSDVDIKENTEKVKQFNLRKVRAQDTKKDMAAALA